MKRNINLFMKKVMDLLGSLICLILLTPLFVFIGILIKSTSKGPVFFMQDRLGKRGKIFKIIKFRTMVVNADKIGDGLFVKCKEDSRITKVGEFLRDTSLDELPQLINVIKGEMSLVGPRPPVSYHPYKYEEYSCFQRKRFEMKPGITGLAQVTVRNSVSWDERIPIDVKYIEEFNFFLDIKLLFKTVQKMFKRESIYIQEKNADNSETKSNIKYSKTGDKNED